MRDHERGHWSIRWEAKPPRHTLLELMQGTRTFRLNPGRDEDLFETLLEHGYLATRHLLYEEFGLFPSRQEALRRLAKLWDHGFLARTRVSARPQPAVAADPALPLERGWEYAWTLTAFAFEALQTWHNEVAQEFDGWKPPYLAASKRNNVIHQVAVADLVIGLRRYLWETRRLRSRWIPAYRAVQRLDSILGRAGRGDGFLSPDAIVLVAGPDAMDVLLVEYEESARPDRVRRYSDAYTRYLNGRTWREAFPDGQPPKVLWSFSGIADRQRYWAHPFDEARAILAERPTLAGRLFLLKEEEWRRGRWLAHGLEPHERPSEVATACVTTPLRGPTATPSGGA